MQCMRLQRLAEMQQAAQFLRGWRKLINTDQLIHRLSGGQMMRHRANATQALHKVRHFPIRATLNEFLEAAKFNNMQACFFHMVIFVQQQGDFAVPFNTRDRIDGDAA